MATETTRWLVTGGAGFVGSHFVKWAIDEFPQLQIVTLDLLTYAGRRENLEAVSDGARHSLVVGDIRDGDLLAELLASQRFDAVVHFAAESHVDRSIDAASDFVTTNFEGTFQLLEAVRRQHDLGNPPIRFHHVSTDEVYGSLAAEDRELSEGAVYSPNSPYAATKAGSDHLVRAYGTTYTVPVTLSHGCNTYGPHQNIEKLIPTILHTAIAGEAIPIYGDGQQRRDWLYVEDHCRGIGAILEKGRLGESYNLAGGDERANLDMATLLCELLDELHPVGAPHARLITKVADRPGHDWRYAIASDKARKELGWQPKTSLLDGLRHTVATALADKKWYEEVRSGNLRASRQGLGADPHES